MRAPFCEAEVRAIELSDFWRLTNWPGAMELEAGRFSDMMCDGGGRARRVDWKAERSPESYGLCLPGAMFEESGVCRPSLGPHAT
ncbi:hypothetical protein KCU61_g422, partial [Aureobasidium melanogenum]